MRIAIVGFGAEGRSSYDYFLARGHDITICDQNSQLETPAGAQTQLGPDYLKGLDQFDQIIRTAGIPPAKILSESPGVEHKISSQLNEFMSVCPSHNIIGVTGTKGKGTTSTLIAKMLEAAGKKAHLGGNIGLPPLELLKNGIESDHYVVLELSSFQLIDLKSSPRIGVCLMVVPEHLDWHPSTEEYVAAKAQLFAYQTERDLAIYYGKNELSKQIASTGHGQLIPYYGAPGALVENGAIKIGGQEVCQTNELKLLGEHNWQNVCAAVTAVWQITQDVAATRSVLTSFTGLEHRLELVRELAGVRYYDDSFGTTPETAIVAIKAFDQPKVVILGGSDKGANYTELAGIVKKSNIRRVLLIGNQAQRIQKALESAGFSDFEPGGANMAEIVANAHQVAQAGDVVLLSPACASFDMFKNYKDRAEQFKDDVNKL